MSCMQDNILSSSNLIAGSMDELNRAIHAADTTMSNAINAFNLLNHTKFLENVVEDMEEAEQKMAMEKLDDQTRMNNESMFSEELLSEKDKIQFALAIAIQEASRKKLTRQEHGDDPQDDEKE